MFNPSVPEILQWIGAHDAKLLMMVHDFYAVCPYFLMVDGEGRFCNGRGDCRACGKSQPEIRHLYGRAYSRGEWQALWSPLFRRADEIRVFSPFAVKLLEAAYPGVGGKSVCIPHDMGYFKAGPVDLPPGTGPRIGVVGSLYSVAKGTRIVRALAEGLPEGEKLTLIGTFAGEAGPRVEVSGRYAPEQLPELLKRHGINVVLFPSVCPETFSFTVSELMQMRVPVIAFGIGAQGDKVSHYDRGLIIPEATPECIRETALELYNKVYGKDRS